MRTARTPALAPLWALPLAPQRVHSKPSTSLLLVPEAGPLVDARLVNSSAVPPFKPRKVSSLLLSLSLSLGRGEFDGRNTSRSKSINLHPRIEIDALFYTGVASLSTALRPLALLSSVLPLPSPPRMSSCTSFASTRSFFSYLFGFYIRSLILTALYSGCY